MLVDSGRRLYKRKEEGTTKEPDVEAMGRRG